MKGVSTVGQRSTTVRAHRSRGASAEAGAAAELPRIWDLFSEDALVPRLLLLAKMIERQTTRQLQRHFGMSLAQWRVLAFVAISGPSTGAFIAESAEVDQAEISRAVKALIEQGLVTREFEQGSRKRLAIAATPAGMEQFARIRKMRQEVFGRITEMLSPRQAAQFGNSLRCLAARVVEDRASASF